MQANDGQASPSRRVLVIEDHVDAAEMLEMALTAYGHVVRVATDGASGVAAAQAFEPQVVLCDIGLPGMDGYEVAARLRQDSPAREALLIALTGYGRDEDRTRCKQAGFDLHLTKPIDVTELQQLLTTPHLRHSQP